MLEIGTPLTLVSAAGEVDHLVTYGEEVIVAASELPLCELLLVF